MKTYKGFPLNLNSRCSHNSAFRWLIVKMKKKPSKKMVKDLNKKGINPTILGNAMQILCFNSQLKSLNERKKEIISILKEQKRNSFEVFEISDIQFGMSMNFWDKKPEIEPQTKVITQYNNLFTYWFVTDKQFNERILIN